MFEVTIGEESVYNFALTDDRDDSIEVNIEGGFIEYELTLVPNSNNFTYTVTLVDTTNVSNISTLIFSANDSMSAVGVLSPRLEICACQNGGNCTQEGILGTVNNVVVLQCTCPGGQCTIYRGMYLPPITTSIRNTPTLFLMCCVCIAMRLRF